MSAPFGQQYNLIPKNNIVLIVDATKKNTILYYILKSRSEEVIVDNIGITHNLKKDVVRIAILEKDINIVELRGRHTLIEQAIYQIRSNNRYWKEKGSFQNSEIWIHSGKNLEGPRVQIDVEWPNNVDIYHCPENELEKMIDLIEEKLSNQVSIDNLEEIISLIQKIFG